MREPPVIVAAACLLAIAASAGPFGCELARCASDADCDDGRVCHVPSELCVDPGTVAPASSGHGAGGTVTTLAPGGQGGGWPESCFNEEQDGDESDVDCGGSDCPRCPAGAHCSYWWECEGGRCNQGYCCGTCGPCETCDSPGHEGICWPVGEGLDPNDDCLDEISCNGASACCSAFKCTSDNSLAIDATGIEYGDALTVEAWLHWLGPLLNDTQWLLGHGEEPEDVGWRLEIVGSSADNAHLRFGWTNQSETCQIETTDLAALQSQWRHVAAVYYDGLALLFEGGRLVAQGACGTGAPLTPESPIIMVNNPQGDRANAILDEIRLTSGALYWEDFDPSTSLSADAATIGLWHLDEARASTAHDASGNGHDGTLSNGGWNPQSVCDVPP